MSYSLRVVVVGLVQGVGFRPFIHRIAVKSGVKGYVRNIGGSEVEIWIEGSKENIEKFFQYFVDEIPPTAIIEEIHIFEERLRGFNTFRIEKSLNSMFKRSAIPPDIAICRDCLREVLDPNNRRYRYAFNSCAWCGPRYSMMYRVPYDRENTSMAKYKLCNLCYSEYTDINNVRRYHAQGISCPIDGPRLYLYTSNRELVSCDDPLSEVAKLINEGYIVAIKGIGGYHIACLATDDDVVQKLRKRKKRPTKPFAIMALNIDIIEKLVYVEPPIARQILESPQRPIVLLPKREDSPVSPYVSPGMDVEGVFLPYTALHYLILAETKDKFAIMTSGNIHGEPMCRDEECVFSKLSSVVDYVLIHDREIVHRVDDSVLRFTDGEPVIIRRSRGYAPLWIRTSKHLSKPAIAFGAHLQTAGAIAFEDKIVLTPFIGDLDSVEALNDLVYELEFLIKSYNIDVSSSRIVVDKHPEYMSRTIAFEYVEKYGSELIEIQHHYAHILSVLADHSHSIDLDDGDIVGIAIDGVGYGDDGAIWGGEIIAVGIDSYKRIAHLRYVPITSDRDTVYPTRLIPLYLAQIMPLSEVMEFVKELKLYESLPRRLDEIEFLLELITRKRFVYTSSMGRFLDAVSALLGVCRYRSYEGEPAILLEASARGGRELKELYIPRPIIDIDNLPAIDTPKILFRVIELLREGYDVKDLAYTVQLRIGEAIANIVLDYAKGRRNIQNIVVVSGGAAVNTYIVRSLKRVLSREGIEILLPRRVPPNDGGIAVGQVYALMLMDSR